MNLELFGSSIWPKHTHKYAYVLDYIHSWVWTIIQIVQPPEITARILDFNVSKLILLMTVNTLCLWLELHSRGKDFRLVYFTHPVPLEHLLYFVCIYVSKAYVYMIKVKQRVYIVVYQYCGYKNILGKN